MSVSSTLEPRSRGQLQTARARAVALAKIPLEARAAHFRRIGMLGNAEQLTLSGNEREILDENGGVA